MNGDAAPDDVTTILEAVDQVAGGLMNGLAARLAAFGRLSADIDNLGASFAAGGTSAGLLLVQAVLVAGLVAGVFLLVHRRFTAAPGGGGWRRLLMTFLAVVLALAAGLIAARLLASSDTVTRTLRLWTVVAIVGCLSILAIRGLLVASRPPAQHRSPRLRRLVAELSIAIGYAMAGLGLTATLRLWGGGAGISDFVRTFLVALPALALFAGAVWRNRRAMAVAVAGSHERSRFRSQLAAVWPGTVIAFMFITVLSAQAALTLGAPLPGLAVILTVLVVFATPHLDSVIHQMARVRLHSGGRGSILSAAARQTARFVVVAAMVVLVGTLWATPIAAGLGFELGSVVRGSAQVALILLAAAFLWNIVGALYARMLHAELPAGAADSDDQHELGVPRSRLATLLPLLAGTAKAAIVALTGLSILVSVGVNVWPLVAGLSVFGLAIGFGSQTLVKDVVSGLFFLVDDAFRLGEYIETSGAKGSVEKISVRSVSLRHPRGPLATIPYGEIGKIQNFSRDWVIEKLVFRVALDTDLDVVRKLFKQIGQQLQADPALAPDLIEPFKSQGIADVEDGTLVIRGKFKARAGHQFMIRRAAFAAVHKGFRDNGVRLVPKPLTGQAPAPG